MKKVKLALFNLLLLPTLLFAQQNGKSYNYEPKTTYQHVKEKSWNKSYPASGKSLEIINQFGDIKVQAGSGNEISISVAIKASSDNPEMAASLIDRINIEDLSKGSLVKLKTKIGDEKNSENKNCKNCNSSMQINYTVNVPASVALELQNSFGAVILPDLAGPINLRQKFGKLNAGYLQKPGKIEVEFCEAELAGANDLVATFKFSKVTIGQLKGKNMVEFSFCEKAVVNLGNSVSYAEIKESYSTLNVRPAANFSASYRIQTSFGEFTNRTAIAFDRTNDPPRYGADTHKAYEGGTSNAGTRIDINSSFGRVVLGEAKPGDMESRKNEKKVRSTGQSDSKVKNKVKEKGAKVI